MTAQEAHNLRDSLNANHWDLNYANFCKLLGYAADEQDEYSQSKWEAFRALKQAVSEFDDEGLAMLLTRQNA